jgi:molecular chaperone DnaJ
MTRGADLHQAMAPDYYRVLGLPPGATVEQVKAAYRRRALRYHPDKNRSANKDNDELFKGCSEAFSTLSDPKKRAQYDGQLLLGRGPRELLSEVVGELLGSAHTRRRRGADLQHTLELTLEQCASAQRHEITLLVDDLCVECHGRGSPPDGTERCPDCEGRGESQRSKLLELPRICPRCAGRGTRNVVSCAACSGVGMVERTRQVELRLPPGVHDGHLQTLRGQGAPGLFGGSDGDLHVLVRVIPHPFFRRDGCDIHVELPVGIWLATAGGKLEVPTLEGSVQMNVPAGTQSGTIFRLRGKGLPKGTKRGDILVQVRVETPVNLDELERSLLQRLDATASDRIYPQQQLLRQQLRERATSDQLAQPASGMVLARRKRSGATVARKR